ncbi:DUF3889 domain-containing protein [Gracilibacillus ureilyticus]|uniref:DUF3889 domain-containing protein n=1 Tax=Gracilibacillus ureilyticus TaxID=531814 RepID=UPI000B7EBB5B|nr:DUF3889 domain-containing protein [Gracilibacillus ureilyticus]
MYYYNPYYQHDTLDNHWHLFRQNYITGQATWTNGGNVTQCGTQWSYNQFMTAAVSTNSPYVCGQSIKVRNPQNGREVIVTIVDKVPGSPVNTINLHQRAFETLGANTSIGVIPIEFQPSPELEQEKWGKFLLELTQTAFPQYNVTEYKFAGRTQFAEDQIEEIYEYTLQSAQDRVNIRGSVIYNPATDRVISFGIAEI